MELRRFAKIENKTLNLELPLEFDGKDVEVIIIQKNSQDDLSFLNKEIERGMNSPVSEKSHEEIFSNLKVKYAY